MSHPAASSSAGITERLRAGTVLGAEGYVFELELHPMYRGGGHREGRQLLRGLERLTARPPGRREKFRRPGVSGTGGRSPS